jgi:tRNA threonylcarbamoyladenosine biosynthesis protein TsaE
MENNNDMSVAVSNAVKGKESFPFEEELVLFANNFALDLKLPLVIWLDGDLGTGKTAFARAFIHALGYKGRVKSPTFGILEHYQLQSLQVLHLDLYRIGDPDELEFLGISDLLDERTVLLVEWPDKGGHWLPEPDFLFKFEYAGEGRELFWTACTPKAESMVGAK